MSQLVLPSVTLSQQWGKVKPKSSGLVSESYWVTFLDTSQIQPHHCNGPSSSFLIFLLNNTYSLLSSLLATNSLLPTVLLCTPKGLLKMLICPCHTSTFSPVPSNGQCGLALTASPNTSSISLTTPLVHYPSNMAHFFINMLVSLSLMPFLSYSTYWTLINPLTTKVFLMMTCLPMAEFIAPTLSHVKKSF